MPTRTEHWDDDHVDNFVVVVADLFGEEKDAVCEQVGKKYKYVRLVAEELERRYPDHRVCIITLDPTKLLDFLVEFEDTATDLWPSESLPPPTKKES